MKMWREISALVASAVLLVVSPAWADHAPVSVLHESSSRGSLRDLIPNLFGLGGVTTQPVKALGCCGPTGHGFHFAAGSQQANQQLANSLTTGLQGAIANAPLPSPAGGFTFQFDPALGVFTRSTESFGPIFADRAETTGRGKFSLGFTYTRFTFDSLDGKNLHDGELKLTFLHEPTADLNRQDPAGRGVGPAGGRPTPFGFERDTITTTLFIDLDSDVFFLSGTYGVLDNLDVAVALPIIRNELKVRAVAKSNNESRTLNADGAPAHLFSDGAGGFTDTQTARTSDESTGIGDLLLRAKYNFYRQPPLAMAAILELRLPTGDEDELRGVGSVRVRPVFVASGSLFGVAPHVNLGFDLGDSDVVDNEFLYKVGFDWPIISRVTFAFDLLGRYVLDNNRIKAGSDPRSLKKADDHIVDAAIGFKFNLWQTLLLSFNVLVPLNDTGLRDDIALTFGIEGTL